MTTKRQYGQGLFPEMKYCTRCCMPETSEGLQFDEMGICQICKSSEHKIHINWVEREKDLEKVLNRYKGKSPSGYDCIVPYSGGKDSTFQLYVLTQIYKLRCLAVTFSHNWFSETGKHNLQNSLDKFNVDHIMYTPNNDLIRRLTKESLYRLGDPCWHCHSGVGTFPFQIAVKYKIPLMVWGESAAEGHTNATYDEPIPCDRDYFTRLSAKYYAEELVGDNISLNEIKPFILPSYEEIEEVGVVGIHLGDYIFWDDERQMEFIRDNFGWKEDDMDGTYKHYKSVECKMSGLHDYTKFLKRGFGRTTDHASRDVRTGLMTREEAFDLIAEFDIKRPKILDWYLELTGLSEEEFLKVMSAHREQIMGKKMCKDCESCGYF